MLDIENMPITWKKSENFKPSVILDNLSSFRSVAPGSHPVFSGLSFDETLPILQNMLDFPKISENVERSTLVWSALFSISGELTPKTFLSAINEVLSKEIATTDKDFHVLTSVSLGYKGLPKSIKVDDSIIRLIDGPYPKKYNGRLALKNNHKLSIEATPTEYTNLIVQVRSKSPIGAMTKALRVIDLQRSIWCLLSNPQMQIMRGEWIPINNVRLGGVHSVHGVDGKVAIDQIWFEPNFVPADVLAPQDIKKFNKNSAYAFRQIEKCKYREVICDALIRYVRALDERDQNTAFLKLWSAIEALTSPNFAKYDNIIRRCSFLFKDYEYHRQVLEHLREYRNKSVHAGDQNMHARTHCFQLQLYFFQLIWFHLRHVKIFNNLDMANEFLDFSPDQNMLLKQKKLLNKVLRFTS